MRGPDHSWMAGSLVLQSRPRCMRPPSRPPGVAFTPLARTQTLYVCRACGGEALKWQGQCAHCRQWDSLEAVTAVRTAREQPFAPAVAAGLEDSSAEAAASPRLSFGLAELDRVFGGGLVAGSVSLL